MKIENGTRGVKIFSLSNGKIIPTSAFMGDSIVLILNDSLSKEKDSNTYLYFRFNTNEKKYYLYKKGIIY